MRSCDRILRVMIQGDCLRCLLNVVVRIREIHSSVSHLTKCRSVASCCCTLGSEFHIVPICGKSCISCASELLLVPVLSCEAVHLSAPTGVPCRCFVMETPLDLAHHLNMVRMNQTNGEVRRIPDVGYNMYKKNFQEPALKEGFTKIKKITFVPKFDTKRDEKIFKQWTS